MTNISILGSGTVGTITGKGFLQLSNQVIFYDIDEAKAKELQRSNLKATCSIEEAVCESEVSFICVPTPITRNAIDLSCLIAVAKDLATCLRKKGDYHVVVVKSTVIPGTTELRVIPLLEKFSRKKAGCDFGVCVNPEFLTEIHQTWTKDDSFQRSFFDKDRVVIGEFDQKSGDTLALLYKPSGIPIIRTNLRTGEMIKYACNCALATKISYWNEIFYICQKAGIDSDLVAKTASMDKRIGKYGTVHGKAFGGKCLPKDLRAFVDYSEKLGYDPILLKAVETINMRIKTERGVRE